jgi:hypothetical protein
VAKNRVRRLIERSDVFIHDWETCGERDERHSLAYSRHFAHNTARELVLRVLLQAQRSIAQHRAHWHRALWHWHLNHIELRNEGPWRALMAAPALPGRVGKTTDSQRQDHSTEGGSSS